MSYKPDPPKGSPPGVPSKKVWDRCISCFNDIPISSASYNWRQCSWCGGVSKFLILFLGIGVLFALWQLWTYSKFKNYNLDLYTVGYLVDIMGGWFLASGLADLFALASSAWGGGESTFVRFGRKNFYRRAIGLFLLTLGFILQCVANIYNYHT